jgi:branched-chain amino acid transport system permease protein
MGQEFDILVLALVIVVLGGPGSLAGAFIASLAVGVADAYGKAFLPSFAEFTMMGLVVVVLAWRPAGLFGTAET